MDVLFALMLIATILLLPIIGIVWLVLRLMRKDTWKTKLYFVGTLCVALISLAGVWAYSCTHQWTEATCLAPKTCMLCEITEGEPAEHQWENGTCITPGVCAVCHATDTNTADHTWIDATCQQRKTCELCGEETGEIADCLYESGKCVYCEADEPLVWIPRTGEKYHSAPNCSGMDDPTEVTLSEAVDQGFDACSKCY